MMENKFLDEPDAIHDDESSSPIYGYQDQQITTLEEAVQSITHVIPNVINYVTQAKLQCRKTNILTEDESAAIYLYTMGSPFFSTLNCHLRAMDRQALRPWFAYLKLFITALNKLPSFKGFVWRGEPKRSNFTYPDYTLQTWWAITSTSKDLKIIEPFLGDTGILYAIEPTNGKDVSQYAANPQEQEVILMPGTRIYLTTEPVQVDNRPFMYSFKEW
jgi:NAD:arginine ADP-ribosyltransferase